MKQNNNEITSLGNCIKEERKRYGLTQSQLGERIGVKASRVSKIENGSPITIETADFILGKMGSKVKFNVVPAKIDKATSSFIISVIYKYAKDKNLPLSKAYKYLKTFKGIDYLKKYKDIEQNAPIEEISRNLTKVCSNNGGML